jgi:arginine deiminase
VVRIDAGRGARAASDGYARLSEEEGLLQGLWGAGIDLEPILCGGGDPLYQEREQWWSGANSFAFAPGKIVMYSCNAHTLEALSDAGFEVKNARDFIGRGEIARDEIATDRSPGSTESRSPGSTGTDGYGRLVVAFDGIELARGGGGARCMTLPVEREALE